MSWSVSWLKGGLKIVLIWSIRVMWSRDLINSKMRRTNGAISTSAQMLGTHQLSTKQAELLQAFWSGDNVFFWYKILQFGHMTTLIIAFHIAMETELYKSHQTRFFAKEWFGLWGKCPQANAYVWASRTPSLKTFSLCVWRHAQATPFKHPKYCAGSIHNMYELYWYYKNRLRIYINYTFVPPIKIFFLHEVLARKELIATCKKILLREIMFLRACKKISLRAYKKILLRACNKI